MMAPSLRAGRLLRVRCPRVSSSREAVTGTKAIRNQLQSRSVPLARLQRWANYLPLAG